MEGAQRRTAAWASHLLRGERAVKGGSRQVDQGRGNLAAAQGEAGQIENLRLASRSSWMNVVLEIKAVFPACQEVRQTLAFRRHEEGPTAAFRGACIRGGRRSGGLPP